MSEFTRLSWNQSERTSVNCDTKQHVKIVLPQSIWDGLLDITATPCDCTPVSIPAAEPDASAV